MKKRDDLRELFPKTGSIFEDGYSLEEIMEQTGYRHSQAHRVMMDNVIRGTWEQGWKRNGDGRIVKSYRKKKGVK